ncbi:hypothetical protein BU24DRAFT_131256 [Aaosphaeria arxii CBS 175.79]|uniref:Apple domain-containing protein n=1 Tax=Aaosphaeria arxii CBS 175.79 TaxID=1450172 RepID=A0A6A5Y3A0_9PLEO|nr:uncharacterized protein BU24DRAFT_131256 [Aaosphaeria arxii CBS 175.79]KAF2020012.1 hypothetical protein BU24DRAFT_131256 [Aaosphaeria arxii CBS 175.79]
MMIPSRSISLVIFYLFSQLLASPVEVKNIRRQGFFPPFIPCAECLPSSWTQGPECKTDGSLQSIISSIQNPPPSATATYTPSPWCSEYLRPTTWRSEFTTSWGISTYTSRDVTHIIITKTDLNHPTSTMFCPSPSPDMECGWDTNTVAPIEQGEDWSIEHFISPEECHQVCLQRSSCKAYRIDGTGPGSWYCEIFNVGLGKNGANLRNPTPSGSQWWDRSCPTHLPAGCKPAQAPETTVPILTSPPPTPSPASKQASPVSPIPTPAPTLPPRQNAALAKRTTRLPEFLTDLEYYWSSIFLLPACTCIISSASPGTLKTTTTTFTSWTGSTTVTTTFEDIFTWTTTPRETTVYNSVN